MERERQIEIFMSNWTEEQLADHYRKAGTVERSSAVIDSPRNKPKRAKKPRVAVLEGPVSVLLLMHGHCPSKKNLWETGPNGQVFLNAEVKGQIENLTLQALLHWNNRPPVEHPEITIRLYVGAKRQDRDGMFTTLLDCLQDAGVLVNDNISRNNGRTILEPCVFVDVADERVEILVEKK